MKLVIVLNVNPDSNIHAKISNNREYTRRELKEILTEGFSGFVETVVFYDNFTQFKKNVSNHLNDFVLNFDFGYKSRIRNMNVPAFCENYNIKYFNPDPYVQVLCQDKFLTEKFAENFEIKTPKSILVFLHSYSKEILSSFNYPVIIKPNYESESIGITQDCIVANIEQAEHMINKFLKTLMAFSWRNILKATKLPLQYLVMKTNYFWRKWSLFSQIQKILNIRHILPK